MGAVEYKVGLLLRSLAFWRGPGKSRPGTTTACHTHRVPWSIAATPARLRPPGRRGLRPSSCCDPCRPMVPCTLAGAAWAPSCVRGRRGSPRLHQQRGGCRALARAGANAPAGEPHGVPSTGSTGAAWSGGTVSCTSACRRLLSGARACCRVRWRRSVQQATRCPSRTRRASGCITLPGARAGHGGARALHPCAWCRVSCHHLGPTGWCGIRRPGWCLCGGRRSVTGKPGHPRRCPATQQGLAGDGE